MAIGRSSPAPVFRTPDGAKFTVTRRDGHDSWLDSNAALTRSRDSRTAASGSPTTGEAGKTGRDMDLDRHRATVDPVQSGGWYGGEHDSSRRDRHGR